MMDAMIWCMPVIGWGVILTALVFGINLLACALEYHKERRRQDDRTYIRSRQGAGGNRAA